MKRLPAVTAACLGLAVLAASPASAQRASFPDHDGGGPIAIQRVIVENKTLQLWVGLRHKSKLRYDSIWIDVAPKDRGPEYRVSMLANSDFIEKSRVERFSSRGKPWKCAALRAHSDNFEAGALSWLRVPQSCLRGVPGKVRVAARSSNHQGARDNAPNWGTYSGRFTRWVGYA